MDILVTGGTVFASRYTAEYFAAQGHNVYVLNRGTKAQSAGVNLICADRHQLGDKLKQYHFDAVIDVTSYCGRDVDHLLDGLREFGEYILISSSAVYPETLPQPFREDQPCGPNSVWGAYGTNKIEAEEALLKRVPGAYILRPPYLYGPMNNLHREAFVFECAENDRPVYLPGDGSQKLQFFHIYDMCRFVSLIIDIKPDQHIFNVGEPESVTIREWAEKCYAVLGKTPQFVEVSSDVPQRSYFPFYAYEYELDVTEMTLIMPDLTPLSQGLTQSWEWFRNNRDLIVRKPLFEFIDNELRGSV